MLSMHNARSEESISISKGTDVPDNVCNNTEYTYNATVSGLDEDLTYTTSWEVTNDNGSVSSSSLTSALIKWVADDDATNGYIGKLKATRIAQVFRLVRLLMVGRLSLFM